MASTAPPRYVRSKPNMQDRPTQYLDRTTREGRKLRYELKVIQQPERARACGSGAKSSADRRPVDPPPVVELKIFELQGSQPSTDITFAYDANFFLFAELEDASRPIARGRGQPAAFSNPVVLTGMPVSGMAYLDRPSEAGYFIFPDLSVRHEGKYRLLFHLLEETKQLKDCDVDLPQQPETDDDGEVTSYFDWRMKLKTDVFDVFSAKKFPGLAESTALSRTVAEQGCRVRIRRDVRMRRRGEGKGTGDYEDEISFERPARAPAPAVDYQRERSRSLSGDSEGGRQRPYEPQPGGILAFGGQQYQQAQPGFAPPAVPPQQPQYAAPTYHHPQQYSHPAPHPPPTQHFAYDRQYAHPQSAYPSTPAMREHVHEDEFRRQSVAGHQNEQFVRHHGAVEQNFNRNAQPYQFAPRSPGPAPVSLPPIRSEFPGKFELQSPQILSSVRSIATLASSPTWLRADERHTLYPQQSAPPLQTPDAARNGKRTFDTTFGSAVSKQPLYNGMRPGSPHEDAYDDDDDEDALLEQMKMNYKRADGSEFTRALPTLE